MGTLFPTQTDKIKPLAVWHPEWCCPHYSAWLPGLPTELRLLTWPVCNVLWSDACLPLSFPLLCGPLSAFTAFKHLHALRAWHALCGRMTCSPTCVLSQCCGCVPHRGTALQSIAVVNSVSVTLDSPTISVVCSLSVPLVCTWKRCSWLTRQF